MLVFKTELLIDAKKAEIVFLHSEMRLLEDKQEFTFVALAKSQLQKTYEL